ncbi:MAG: hypothetical protein FWG63_10700 [Defluviitaleaceae bacterium]|nr:hypothetical protein [Defluviitaleaceae bacterium]
MFGIVLLLVGSGLVNNGYCIKHEIDLKSASVVNFFTATILFIANLTFMIRDGLYLNAGLGMMFAFTYYYIGVIDLFKLDLRPFGVYSLGVSISLLPWLLILAQEADWWMFALGVVWFAIFFLLWVEDTLGKLSSKKSKRFIAHFYYFSGVFSGWVPGLLILTDKWPPI